MKEIVRLRIKFMLYNMIIVTVVIGAAFFAAAFLVKNRIMEESNSLLSRAAEEETGALIFEVSPQVRVPYFTVVVDQDGMVFLNEGAYNSFPDQHFLEQIAKMGLTGVNDRGDLEEYHLRYLRISHPLGFKIAFVDTSYEDSISSSLLRTSVMICGAIWVCFLILSYFFSKWAVRPVEESVRMQKQFVADASHELKTPLTVIMANTELLEEQCTGISPDVDKWLHNVHQESIGMRSLVEDLLLLAKSEVLLQNPCVKEKCSLSDLVMEGILTFEPVFYQNEKNLDYEIADDIQMKGNPEQIRQLMKIFLDNAVKYSSPHGNTEVVLERFSKRKARLWVKSEGTAIPKDRRKAVFRRFYRGDEARSGQGGYGLGLAIAQGIARNHRAGIGVEYMDGMNCFYVDFKIVVSQ